MIRKTRVNGTKPLRSRFLITGGAGFIGSHLAERLLRGGHRVDVIDDLSTGSIANITKIKGHPGFRFCFGSVHDRGIMSELVGEADAIVHLAAAVGVRLIVEQPVHTLHTNVHGTEVVLELASKQRKRVMIASTSEVYGKSSRIPFVEDADVVLGATTKARWGYACSKALDEFLALAYHQEKDLPVTIVRLFNTVGPRQTGRYGMVVPTFVRQALRGEPITVFGDGSQSRCFVHVSDVVEALAALLTERAFDGEVYNVGNAEEVTILELARRIVNLTGSRSPIVCVPYDEAYAEGFEDMPRRVPSLAKVQTAIGYRPRRDLTRILCDVIDFESERFDDRVPTLRVLPPRPAAIAQGGGAID